MSTSSPELFSREEVLSGMTARRARTLLFLIESRSARLAAQAQQAMATYRTARAAEEDELSFFTAFTEGRDPPLKPTIQDIEHYSGAWAQLAPNDPRLRAAVAHALAEKYRFAHQHIPGIRLALGLDDNRVQGAYQKQYHTPITDIYQENPGGIERIHWAWTRLAGWVDGLPPFWTSFALTLTETVGSGILALPIALAGIGPLPGILLVALMGLINVVTIICASEAAARSGIVRYGSGFMGLMVNDYLGKFASNVLTVGLAVFSIIQLLAVIIGFGTTMAPLTGLPQWVWVIALFIIGLYFLRRESLNATVASALVVGAISLLTLFLLMLLVIPQLQPANLLYFHVPFINGEPFKPGLLELIFGVVLAAFFGHMSVNNCARVVLRRDGSARSLIGGAATAQVVSIVLYSIWILVIAGSIPSADLAASTGTVLEPLANRIGPVAVAISTIYAVLTLAMGSVYNELSLFNLVSERLPVQSQHSITLPRRRGRLVFTPRNGFLGLFQGKREIQLRLSYLGLDGPSQATCPRLRLDLINGNEVRKLELTPGRQAPANLTGKPLPSTELLKGKPGTTQTQAGNTTWDESAITDVMPELEKAGVKFHLEVMEASLTFIRLSVLSSMTLKYEGEWENPGLDLTALLDETDSERRVWRWLSRQPEPHTIQEIAAKLETPEIDVQEALKSLVSNEFASETLVNGTIRYRARFASRRGHSLPEALKEESVVSEDSQLAIPKSGAIKQQANFWLNLSRRKRYWICSLPTVAVFLLTEWLLLNGKASFSMAFSLSGVLLGSLLAGFLPVLLLIASRRKGDVVPGLAPRLVGNPLILAMIYLVYLAGVLIYGLVIWQQPVERIAAIGVGLLAIAIPFLLLRQGTFRKRAVIELRADRNADPKAVFTISAAGQPQPLDVLLHYKDSERPSRAASGEISEFNTVQAISFRSRMGSAKEGGGPAKDIRDVKVWAHTISEDGDDQALAARATICADGQARTYELEAFGGQVVQPIEGTRIEVNLEFQD